MRTWHKTTVVMVVAVAALTGCGRNPAAAPETEKRVGQYGTIKKGATAPAQSPLRAAGTAGTSQSKATKPATTVKPGVSQKPGTTTTTTPAKPVTTGGTAPANAGGFNVTKPQTLDQEGALRLTIRLWGTSPVGAIKLLVFAPDATQGVEVPMQLTGPEAVWEADALPPGHYTLRVQAFDPANKPIGQGSTQAVVKDGELIDLTLDVTTNKVPDLPTGPDGTSGVATTPTPAPTATPSATPTATPTAAPTAAPTATPTPAPTGPGMGGTLGLRVEIF